MSVLRQRSKYIMPIRGLPGRRHGRRRFSQIDVRGRLSHDNFGELGKRGSESRRSSSNRLLLELSQPVASRFDDRHFDVVLDVHGDPNRATYPCVTLLYDVRGRGSHDATAESRGGERARTRDDDRQADARRGEASDRGDRQHDESGGRRTDPSERPRGRRCTPWSSETISLPCRRHDVGRSEQDNDDDDFRESGTPRRESRRSSSNRLRLELSWPVAARHGDQSTGSQSSDPHAPGSPLRRPTDDVFMSAPTERDKNDRRASSSTSIMLPDRIISKPILQLISFVNGQHYGYSTKLRTVWHLFCLLFS